MAFLQRRADGRVEIRETVPTSSGPRSRTLAVVRGGLTPDALDRAEARALRPFSREALLARARAGGIAVTARREDRAARELLGLLCDGREVDPVLLARIRDELAPRDLPPVPERLADVLEWIGASLTRRGEALRGLLRVYDRAARGRSLPVRRATARFPRFRSRTSR